ncbi:MAG: phosphoribosyltransferase [Candidatus Omnitrophica bacterium]|nr:phosphoribosyltransferase [Candidatus Omnitrophota bacterium]
MKENIKIVQHGSGTFSDRSHAGKMLAEALKDYDLEDPLILGIPRGGVVVAEEVADSLGSQLDIVLSSKLAAPVNPELAIGAVSETGKVFMDPRLSSREWPEGYIESEKREKMGKIERRREIFRKARPKARMEGRTLVVVDDGLATGSTMEAALWGARQERPSKLIAAVPVASESALGRISEAADQVLCVRLPSLFMAVSQFYANFPQTTDEEVIEILKKASTKEKKGNGP